MVPTAADPLNRRGGSQLSELVARDENLVVPPKDSGEHTTACRSPMTPSLSGERLYPNLRYICRNLSVAAVLAFDYFPMAASTSPWYLPPSVRTTNAGRNVHVAVSSALRENNTQSGEVAGEIRRRKRVPIETERGIFHSFESSSSTLL